ncbi:MAG: bile acid:sodium symporter family protein, partial [Methyloligellaceae bacterium]
MIDQLIDISIPTLTFLLMCIVGAELAVHDFKNVIETPFTVIVSLLGQIFILPLCAIAIVLLLNPHPGIVVGLLLLAVCPGGVLSNLYVYLFAGNVALSVTLTALTTLMAVLYTPVLCIWLLEQFGQKTDGDVLHFSVIASQLVYFVLIPVLLGMTIRALNEKLVANWKSFMQFFSLAGILILVSTILLRQWENLLPSFASVAPIAISYTLLTLFSGYLISLPFCKHYP